MSETTNQQQQDQLINLWGILQNESLSLTERQTAAHLAVELQIGAVPTPADEDPEVVALRTPWPERYGSTVCFGLAWAVRNEHEGWNAKGPTIQQARKYIVNNRREAAVLAIICDTNAHLLERTAAAEYVLSRLPEDSYYIRQNYTPERMLVEVLPATATRWTTKGCEQVSRPPLCMADVWGSKSSSVRR